MKRCPYCGTEYPDDATECSIDRQPLPENVPQLPPASEQIIGPAPGAVGDGAVLPQGQMETADKNTPYLTFPDYQWSARDAWKCLGMLLVFQFVLGLVTFALDSQFPGFHRWHRGGVGLFSIAVFSFAIFLLTAAYFARTETLATFWKGFGLDRKPSECVWFGVTMALIIRGFGHFMIIHGWGKGVTNHDIIAFKNTLDPERYFFLAPLLLLAPFFEESINRGFLYKAFRGSYAMGISMVLIVAWTACTHWSQYSHSWVAALDLSMLTIVQCYLREKSDSLWDCILCHLAYNGSGLFIDGVFR
ncbi:MAG: lysostaphin resistance A-like protein [Limisphaerales bacterium]